MTDVWLLLRDAGLVALLLMLAFALVLTLGMLHWWARREWRRIVRKLRDYQRQYPPPTCAGRVT